MRLSETPVGVQYSLCVCSMVTLRVMAVSGDLSLLRSPPYPYRHPCIPQRGGARAGPRARKRGAAAFSALSSHPRQAGAAATQGGSDKLPVKKSVARRS